MVQPTQIFKWQPRPALHGVCKPQRVCKPCISRTDFWPCLSQSTSQEPLQPVPGCLRAGTRGTGQADRVSWLLARSVL